MIFSFAVCINDWACDTGTTFVLLILVICFIVSTKWRVAGSFIRGIWLKNIILQPSLAVARRPTTHTPLQRCSTTFWKRHTYHGKSTAHLVILPHCTCTRLATRQNIGSHASAHRMCSPTREHRDPIVCGISHRIACGLVTVDEMKLNRSDMNGSKRFCRCAVHLQKSLHHGALVPLAASRV